MSQLRPCSSACRSPRRRATATSSSLIARRSARWSNPSAPPAARSGRPPARRVAEPPRERRPPRPPAPCAAPGRGRSTSRSRAGRAARPAAARRRAVERLLEQRHLVAVDGADDDAEPGAPERGPRQPSRVARGPGQDGGLEEAARPRCVSPARSSASPTPRAAAAAAAPGRPRSRARSSPPPSRRRAPPAPRRPPRTSAAAASAPPPPAAASNRCRAISATSPRARRQHVGDLAVQPDAADRRELREQRLLHQRVGERAAPVAVLAHQPGRERPLERRQRSRPSTSSSVVARRSAGRSPRPRRAPRGSGPSRSSRWPITSRTPSGRPSAPDSAALRNSSRAKNGLPPVRRWHGDAPARPAPRARARRGARRRGRPGGRGRRRRRGAGRRARRTAGARGRAPARGRSRPAAAAAGRASRSTCRSSTGSRCSAQCRSSSTTTAAARARRRAGRRPPRTAGSGPRPAPGGRREAGQDARQRRLVARRQGGRRLGRHRGQDPASASAHAWNGTSASSAARPASTDGAARGRPVASSATSRVLPMPGSPATSSRPVPPWRIRSNAAWASRELRLAPDERRRRGAREHRRQRHLRQLRPARRAGAERRRPAAASRATARRRARCAGARGGGRRPRARRRGRPPARQPDELAHAPAPRTVVRDALRALGGGRRQVAVGLERRHRRSQRAGRARRGGGRARRASQSPGSPGASSPGRVAVDLDARREADRLPVDHEQRVRVGAEAAAQRRQRGPQAGARRSGVHVRPELRGDERARLAAGVQREPGEQQPRRAAVDRAERAAVAEHPHAVDQLHLVHGFERQRASRGRCRTPAAFTPRSRRAHGTGRDSGHAPPRPPPRLPPPVRRLRHQPVRRPRAVRRARHLDARPDRLHRRRRPRLRLPRHRRPRGAARRRARRPLPAPARADRATTSPPPLLVLRAARRARRGRRLDRLRGRARLRVLAAGRRRGARRRSWPGSCRTTSCRRRTGCSSRRAPGIRIVAPVVGAGLYVRRRRRARRAARRRHVPGLGRVPGRPRRCPTSRAAAAACAWPSSPPGCATCRDDPRCGARCRRSCSAPPASAWPR